MERRLKTLPFALGLICVLFYARLGAAQPAPCKTAVTTCHSCCAAMPCCLGATPAPSLPEPLSTASNPHLEQAAIPVVYTLLSSFDFLARPPETRRGESAVQRLRTSAPRAAVSCIWLI